MTVPLGEGRVVGADGVRATPDAQPLPPGSVALEVSFTAPEGQALDDRYGSPARLSVDATPPALLVAGGGRAEGLVRELRLDPAVGEGVLHVSASVATCDEQGEHPACRLHRAEWQVPVVVADGAEPVLRLTL